MTRQYPNRLTIWIDPETLAKLKLRAKEERRPFTWVVRDILTAAVSPPLEAANAKPVQAETMTDAELAILHARMAEVKDIRKK